MRRIGGLVFCALWIASCTHAPRPDANAAFDSDTATSMFTAGYALLQDKYIEPVTAEQMAMAGLNGIEKLDDAISFDRQGD